jgi:hypothetical protein
MMRVDLITRADAITVLSTFFVEKNWHDHMDDHFDMLHAKGMEFLYKEDLIDFVVNHTQAVIEPVHTRLFCSGLIAGIKAEADRNFHAEVDQVLEALSASLEGSPATDANQTNMTEVA